jgi:hypothetical protein
MSSRLKPPILADDYITLKLAPLLALLINLLIQTLKIKFDNLNNILLYKITKLTSILKLREYFSR